MFGGAGLAGLLTGSGGVLRSPFVELMVEATLSRLLGTLEDACTVAGSSNGRTAMVFLRLVSFVAGCAGSASSSEAGAV